MWITLNMWRENHDIANKFFSSADRAKSFDHSRRVKEKAVISSRAVYLRVVNGSIASARTSLSTVSQLLRVRMRGRLFSLFFFLARSRSCGRFHSHSGA